MGQFEVDEQITPNEKEVIKQLRERVKNELPETIKSMTEEDQDLYLVRWARARDLNLENATKMLLNSLEWRKERNANEAAKFSIHPFFKETYQFKFAGTDKKGHPVLLMSLPQWDFRKLINDKDRMEEFDDFTTHYCEVICNRIREEHLKRHENGHPPITQVMIIIDTKDYPYGQLLSFGAMKKLLQMASVYEAHYPEILFQGFFINCPSYFNLFITMLKPVIAPKTLSK